MPRFGAVTNVATGRILIVALLLIGLWGSYKWGQYARLSSGRALQAAYELAEADRPTGGSGSSSGPWIETLSWSPRVFLYHNFLTDEETDHIIAVGKNHLAASQVVGQNGNSVKSDVRTSSGVFLTGDLGNDEVIQRTTKARFLYFSHPFIRISSPFLFVFRVLINLPFSTVSITLLSFVFPFATLYLGNFPLVLIYYMLLLLIPPQRIALWTQIPEPNGEPMYLIRYENGQQYQPHHDYFSNDKDGQPFIQGWGNRMATVLMYLQPAEEGGETSFPEANLVVKVRPSSIHEIILSRC